MNSLMVGIPSYRPEDTNLFRERLEYSIKNLKNISGVVKNTVDVCVCSQKWNNEDFEYFNDNLKDLDLNIHYLKYNEGLGCSDAKNRILDEFYNSDYKFILMCDDDAYICNHYKGIDIVKLLYDNPEKFSNADMIRFKDPRLPYKIRALEYRERLESSIVLTYSFSNKLGGIHVLKNLKQEYNLSKDDDVYYYKGSYTINGETYKIHDDVFRKEIMRARGFKVYNSLNTFFEFHPDSVREGALESNQTELDNTRNVIRYICGRDNLIKTDDNPSDQGIRYRIYLKSKDLTPDIDIPRETPYKFTERELTVKHRTLQNE